MGEPKRGVFWDRWLQAYYADRIRVDVAVERVLHVPEDALPPAAPPQAPPRNGAGPRVDVARAAKRLRKVGHTLAGWRGDDGFPVIAPVTVGADSPAGIELTS